MTHIVAVVLTFVISLLPAIAAPIEFNLCKFQIKPHTLFFSNGVGNSIEQAYGSLNQMHEVLTSQSNVDSGEFVTKDIAKILYHANNGLFQDISETLLQKARAEARDVNVTWDNIVSVANGVSTTLTLGMSQLVMAITGFEFDQLKAKSLAQVDLESKADYSLVMQYLNQNPDSRILLVGHSQGTLYANGVYENAVKDKEAGQAFIGELVADRIRVINVGAAADRVAGQVDPANPPQYVTSKLDSVIFALRGLAASVDLNPPLPTNTDAKFNRSVPGLLGVDTDSLMNHGFVSTYLYDTSSSYPLQKLLRNAMLEHVKPYGNSIVSSLEVEVDLNAPKAQHPRYVDSTIMYTPNRTFNLTEAYKFSNQYFSIDQDAGITTYKSKFQISCDMAKTLNLRPDHPDSATTRDITSDKLESIVATISTSLANPISVAAARLRVVPSDGSAPSPWSPIDVTRATQVGVYSLNLPLFSYSEFLRPGSMHMVLE